MKKDILIVLRSILLADPIISGYVGINVRVKDLPKKRTLRQITLRKSYGKSNSIITLVNPTVFITTWIREKEKEEVTENDQPYQTCANIVHKIIDLFNRKGESLNSGDLIINQMVKVDAEIYFNDSKKEYIGVVTFDIVTND